MKQVYAEVVTRFLADQGCLFRNLRNRWWHMDDGYWNRDQGRLELEKALVNWMHGYAPDAQRSMGRSDMNDMCAFMALVLTTDRLPAKCLDVDQDPRLYLREINPIVRTPD
jgi:hypothetical protein